MPAPRLRKRAPMHTKRPEKSLSLNICLDYKPKQLVNTFDDKYIQYQEEGGDEELPTEECLEKLQTIST